MLAGSRAGGSSSRCCSASSVGPTRCGRSAAGCAAARASSSTWGSRPRVVRPTLAYANEHRPWQLYRAVFEALLLRCPPLAQGRRKFRFKNTLVSLDSTVIDLCATALRLGEVPPHQGGGQAALPLDHDGYLPSVVVVTEGKRHDVRVARTLRFHPGTIVVMDRGYTDYAWFGHLTA